MNAHTSFNVSSIANDLAREAARRFNAAVTLADRMDAIDYGRDQTIEANERADRIVERLMPRMKAPNGFYEPDAFIAAAQHNARRGELRAVIRERLLAKIVERDGLLDDILPDPDAGWRGSHVASTWGMA